MKWALSLLIPALRKVQDAYERSQQVQTNLQVAFALAAYKADNGKYPLSSRSWRRSKRNLHR